MGQPNSKASKKQPTDKVSNEVEPPKLNWLEGRGFSDTASPVYILPNDQTEMNRLNSQHYQLKYIFQRLYMAPLSEELKKGISVLDVGCGTGIWAAEMAAEYPASIVQGLDIADVFKATKMPPPNCSFVQADARQGLPFADNTFDYVFSRASALAYPTNVWPLIINEFVRVVKPGGTVEIFELVMPLHDGGPATTKFYHEWMRTSLKLRDVDMEAMIPRFEPLLKSSGVESVTHVTSSWPLGWGPTEEYARLSRENVIDVMKASKPKLTVVLGINDDEYDANTAKTEKELLTYKPYLEAHVFYGKKAK